MPDMAVNSFYDWHLQIGKYLLNSVSVVYIEVNVEDAVVVLYRQ